MVDFVMAREIMGLNFLGISEVEQHFGTLNAEQREALAVIPFSQETLRSCAKTHILVADVGIPLLDVRSKARKGLFYTQNWYEGEKFASRTEAACWRLIRKTPVDGSYSQNWNDQQKLIDSKIDEVPSARQVVYMTILHFLVTGERLFEKVYVRTCDVSLNTEHVIVGHFDGTGFFVSRWPAYGCDEDLGFVSARKAA